MPKGKKGKGPSFEEPASCVDVFGVAQGAQLITPSGVDVTVVGMGKLDGFLYATYPGNYVAPLGDADGQPVADWEELLNAGYTLNRHYVRELVHVIDGKRVFDPKMPVEHDATVFANQSELTSKMLQDMITDAHVPAAQMKELSLLSGKERERKQRLIISEMPEAVLLPKIRDILQDTFTGPDNIKKILKIEKFAQPKTYSPHKESLLLSRGTTFDMTFPTSPQKVAAASSAHITKDYFAKSENRDEKANLPWQVKCYFDKHYDPLVLPPVVKQYFALNPVEPPPEKKGKKGKKGKKKK